MNPEMLTEASKKNLEKQQYRIIGSHSAVKVCGWTKSMIRGRGSCYKHKFYGIRSNQCLQMTTSMFCANRCVFCWRDYKAPVSEDWKWDVDDPGFIIDEALKSHQKLLVGFFGNKTANKRILEESKTVRHVALSLTGEPITYPKINQIINEFHKRRISTFLVTNGQYPEAVKNIKRVTQLYLSVDAPNKKLLKKIDKPLFRDYWKRLLRSLDYMSKAKYRTCIRLTLVKGMNMEDLEGYKELIERGKPDFIEVKAYMFIGASRLRLKESNMPRHNEVKKIALELDKILPDYEYVSEHVPSRVVLLAKKSFRKKTGIDFEGFFKGCS